MTWADELLRRAALVGAVIMGWTAPGFAQGCDPATEGYTLDWNRQSYAAGSLSYTASVVREGTSEGDFDAEPVSIDLAFSGETGRFLGGFPQNSTFFQGGKGGAQNSLAIAADFPAMDRTITSEFTFSRAVDDLRFEVFDVDYSAATNRRGGFRDSVIVTGYTADGQAVLPRLTTPYNSNAQGQVAPSTVYVGNPIASNRGAGNPVNGSGASNNDQDLGNMIVQFSRPVVRVTLDYATRSDYFDTRDPGPQGIAVFDLEFCVPRTAILAPGKDVTIHSETAAECGVFPGSADPAATSAVPGACFEYRITIENTGTGAASDIRIADPLSEAMIFAGARVEGFDKSDPDYAFISPVPMSDCGVLGCTVEMRGAGLPRGATGVIIIRAILK